MSGAATVDQNRRDFLFLATGAVAAVGVGAVAWPLIDQMNPDASIHVERVRQTKGGKPDKWRKL